MSTAVERPWPAGRPAAGAARTRGQAAVEVVALTPLLLLLVAGLVTTLLALTALVGSEHALDRGVVAAAAGQDAVDATRAALPARLRADARVRVEEDVLRLRVDLPGVAPVVELEAPLPAGHP